MRGETVLVDGVPVENVLVEPGEHVDEDRISVPTGTKIAYTLRFPIAYDEPVSDSFVTVRGNRCRTVGYSDHYNPQRVFDSWTGDWDMTVLVELVAGDMSAFVEIFETAVSVDALGDFTRTESQLYAGDAQARMESGMEQHGGIAEVSVSETWHFVVPWQEAFSSLRPQSTFVDYLGARYNVTTIENVDNASQFCDFKAVRNG